MELTSTTANWTSKQYGQSTADAVHKFKDDRKIINFSYQKALPKHRRQDDHLAFGEEIVDQEKANAPEFIDLTKTQINLIKADAVRSRQMLDIVLRRLRDHCSRHTVRRFARHTPRPGNVRH